MHKKGENKIYEKNDVTKEFILKCNITLEKIYKKNSPYTLLFFNTLNSLDTRNKLFHCEI